MAFRWLTDIHLDHAPEDASARLFDALRARPGDPVILTGDVSVASHLVADLERLADAAAAPVYLVLGNHDHYGSSVGKVRDAVTALAARRPEIAWLPPAGVIALPDGRALVGVDGWGDGRHGDGMRTPLVLNDDRLIGELAGQEDRVGKLAVRRALADADAARLDTLLTRAVEGGAREVVVATHIPPFVAALTPGTRIAHPHWHPLLVCGATGEVLHAAATSHPGVRFTVLAGHSHAAHAATILPNLTIRVGGARYGQPMVQPDTP